VSESNPIPLTDLDDRAAALARRLDLVRTSITGDEYVLTDDLERLEADLRHCDRGIDPEGGPE
jgi:hypothetical protein